MQRSRRLPRWGSRLLLNGLVLVLAAGCSGRVPEGPTEAEVHSGDLRPVGPMTDTHVFACADGSRLFVQFGRGAPTITIRERSGGTPLVLTAAANGRPYQGHGIRAVIADSHLRIELADGSRRTCTRQTRG